MPLTIVVGGQFGSEGKGKVAHFFAKYKKTKAVIRCGGVNSGHSIRDAQGKLHVFRQLPTAALIKGVTSILVPGSYIDLDTLRCESKVAETNGSTILIDPKAVVLTDAQASRELHSKRKATIGSTGAGVAEALMDRISRTGNALFARDVPELRPYIEETSTHLRRMLDDGDELLLEGTQGFGLSLLHSDLYPFVTSRDTSASAFLSEAGLSPFDVSDIVLVIRSYPIRVGGNSGPMKKEITWEEVSIKSKRQVPLREFTTVTKRLRRVSEFDADIVRRAISLNQPNTIVLNHMDYVPEEERETFVSKIESEINREISWVGLDDIGLYSRQHQGKKVSNA